MVMPKVDSEGKEDEFLKRNSQCAIRWLSMNANSCIIMMGDLGFEMAFFCGVDMRRFIGAVACMVVVLSFGCTIDEPSKLGMDCPGVASVKVGTELECAKDQNFEVCKGYTLSGVFSEQKCPNNFECKLDSVGNYCDCITSCGSDCCELDQHCSEKSGKCVVNEGVKCQSNDVCESGQQCVNGDCIECDSAHNCLDNKLKCDNGHCVECISESDCGSSEPTTSSVRILEDDSRGSTAG